MPPPTALEAALEECRAAHRMGNVLAEQQDFEGAAQAHERALGIAEAASHAELIAMTRAALAADRQQAAEQLGAGVAALDPHRDLGDQVSGELRVLAAWRKTADAAAQARCLARLTVLLMAADQLDDAEGTAYEHLAFTIRNRLGKQRTFALGQLGEVTLRRGRYAVALRLLNYQYDLAREPGGDGELQVEALDRLATAYLRLGRIELAELALGMLAALPEGANATPALRGRRLDNLGLIARARGSAVQAETCFRAGLEGFDEGDASAEALDLRLHLARLLSERGDRERSIDALVCVQDHGRYHPLGLAGAHLQLGRQSHDEGDLAAALRFFGAAADIARRLGDTPLLAEALTAGGKTSLAAGDIAAAEAAAVEAIDAVESQGLQLDDASGVALFAHQEAPFRLLQRAQLARGASDAALEAGERGRTRALLQLLAARQAGGRRVRDNKATIDAAAFDVMMDRSGQVAGVSIITASRLRHAVEVLALPKVEPEPRPKPVVAEMQAIAAAHDASLLVYSVLGGPADEIAIWLVQADAVHHRMAPPRASGGATLAEEVAAVVAALTEPGSPAAALDAVLGRLYERLIAPLAGLLAADALLCIVPDGVLFRLPFAALRDAGGAPLVARHPLAYAPSVEVLALSRDSARLQLGRGPAGPALIVGAPNPVRLPAGFHAAQPLAELGYAAQEARDIADMLGAEAPLLAADATLAAVRERLPAAALAHFAAHALLDDVRPQASAILLAAAAGSAEAAALTVAALQDLSLRASLVVLSACGTALGPVSGDGIAGFARALLTTGTPSAVVALWPLADASTWDLMTSFYGRLVVAGDDAATALRVAMLEQRSVTPHPRDWAAMVLYGQASTTIKARAGVPPAACAG